MRLPRSLAIVACALFAACTKGESTPDTATAPKVTTKEAERIAEEAYIYAYPMMESYRAMYAQSIDRSAPGHLAGLNQIAHQTELLGPGSADVERPSNDTMHSFAWLELRAQPVVITVPQIRDRYYSIQLVDMFTHNFGRIGTRSTGGEAGSYLVTGPRWEGVQPDDVKAVFRSKSSFVHCVVRIEVRGPEDVSAVEALQEQIQVTPLPLALGDAWRPSVSGITFPRYDRNKAQSEAFIDLLGFLLAEVEVVPEEKALMERFARIRIEPGATSASLELYPDLANAIDAGVGRGLVAIRKAAANPADIEGVRVRAEGGWQGVDGLYGDGATMRPRYLARAAAAMVGLYGNETAEVYAPMGDRDAAGRPLDGSKHRYVMRFGNADRPPVDAFWSMTVYDHPDQRLTENAIDRYSIGDRSGLRPDKDGTFTIYIQHDSPGPRLQSNWLPAPAGAFSLQLRMYLPQPNALDPLYLPPPVEAVE